jgi:hypothetical protein
MGERASSARLKPAVSARNSYELGANHEAMITVPEELAQVLLEIEHQTTAVAG